MGIINGQSELMLFLKRSNFTPNLVQKKKKKTVCKNLNGVQQKT